MEYTINLEPQLDAFLQSKVDDGQYGSATDVIKDALHRLAESEADARLLRSLAQAEAGEDLDMDQVFDELNQQLEKVEQRRRSA